jgi:predicted signal transduction protein with EAL and GGDEF domain
MRLGVSIGQARLKEDGQTLEQLLEAAETRLQADKAARRSFSQWAASASPCQVGAGLKAEP